MMLFSSNINKAFRAAGAHLPVRGRGGGLRADGDHVVRHRHGPARPLHGPRGRAHRGHARAPAGLGRGRLPGRQQALPAGTALTTSCRPLLCKE